jgi:hypothetical protein
VTDFVDQALVVTDFVSHIGLGDRFWQLSDQDRQAF